jgi:hypothetical protein
MAQGRRGATAWCVVCTSLGLLAGHVQVAFYVLPVALLYAGMSGREAADTRTYARGLEIVAILGVLLTAAQWLPSLELFSISERSAASTADVTQYSAPFAEVAAKLFPGTRAPEGVATHELGAVGGLLVLALAFPAIVSGRRLDWMWLGVAAGGVVLALGTTNPLSATLNDQVPFRWGRTPARALLLVTLAACVLAGRGMAQWWQLSKEGPAQRRRLSGFAAIALVVAIGAGVAIVGVDRSLLARAAVTSVVLAAAVLAVPLVARRDPRLWWTVPALVVAGTFLGGAPNARTTRSDFFTTDWASLVPPGMRESRSHLLSGRLPNVERQGMRTLREVCYVDAWWYQRFVADPNLPRAAWLDVAAELADVPRERVLTGVLGEQDLVGRPLTSHGPGLVFHAARVEPDTDRALSALDGGQFGLQLAEEVENASNDSVPVAGSSVSRIAGTSPTETAFDVDSSIDGWLAVSEKHYPGWSAAVNGTPVEVHRANVMFRAVQIPAGRSTVTFTYAPWSVRLGLLLSALGALAGVVWLVASRRRR